MITLMLGLLRLLPFLVGGHCQLALENLALRQQFDVYKRTMARPPLRRTDRLFWVVLARVWTGWRRPLVIVTPNTVLRWPRRVPDQALRPAHWRSAAPGRLEPSPVSLKGGCRSTAARPAYTIAAGQRQRYARPEHRPPSHLLD